MEIKLTSRILCWLFGRSRTPLHDEAVRLADVQKGDTVKVYHNESIEKTMTLTSKPYLWIKWYRGGTNDILISWWVVCDCQYNGYDYVVKNLKLSLYDMGIARQFASYIGQARHYASSKYAVVA